MRVGPYRHFYPCIVQGLDHTPVHKAFEDRVVLARTGVDLYYYLVVQSDALLDGLDNPVVYLREAFFCLDNLFHSLAVLLEEVEVRQYLKALGLDHQQPLGLEHFQELFCRVRVDPFYFILVIHVDRTYDAVEILQMLVYKFQGLLVVEYLPVNFHEFKWNWQAALSARRALFVIQLIEESELLDAHPMTEVVVVAFKWVVVAEREVREPHALRYFEVRPRLD